VNFTSHVKRHLTILDKLSKDFEGKDIQLSPPPRHTTKQAIFVQDFVILQKSLLFVLAGVAQH